MRRQIILTCAAVVLLAASSGWSQAKWFDGGIKLALKAAADQGKPVLAVFYSAKSAACKRADARVFRKPEFSQAAEGWIIVREDVKRTPSLTQDYELTALPTTVFMFPSGDVIGRYVGTRTLEEYTRAVSRAKTVVELVGVDPTKLSTEQCDTLLDALFAFEAFPGVVSALEPRVKAGLPDAARQRREQVILGASMGRVGDAKSGAEFLGKALPGVEVAPAPDEAVRAVSLLALFRFIEPAYDVPIGLSADEEFAGLIAPLDRDPESLVRAVDELAGIARDGVPEGIDGAAAGKTLLRAGNPARAAEALRSALMAGVPDERVEVDLSLALASALVASGDPVGAVQLVDQLLTRYPKTDRAAEALCIGALACAKSGDEVRYLWIVDSLHEFHEDTLWYRLAYMAKQLLKSL